MPQTIYIKEYDTEVEIPDGADMAQVQEALKKQFPPKGQPQAQTPTSEAPEWAGRHPNLYGAAGAAREVLGPVVEGLGLAGGALYGGAKGAIVGSPAGPPGAAIGAAVGAPLGAGAGYGAAKSLTNLADVALGNKKDDSVLEGVKRTTGDIAEGATIEAAGPVIAKPVGATLGLVGKGVKQVLGSTTGAGPGMVDEALKGGKAFKDAMRGKTEGGEIVESVKGALNTLKEQRATAYREQLTKITENKGAIDISPLKQKALNYLSKYRVGLKPEGGLNFENSHLPKQAASEVEQAFNDILRWDDVPENVTAIGLDTLKRRLGNYYSDSSSARAIIADLEGETKRLILKEVPQYSNMTKGYSDATRLIKDVEKGLMLKKGMTEDQSLRRLTSAMRENFEMRRDLVNILGEKAGEDLAGQIGGYSASQLIPRGLVGKLTAGSAGYFTYLNPKFWPLLAASSPRAVGEFMAVYGKALTEAKKVSPATYRTAAYGAMPSEQINTEQ